MTTTIIKTSWPSILILIGAGASVALHIGKVPAALPLLQFELGLSLVQSGWVISIFSLIAATMAIFLGTVADRFGHRRLVVLGMILTATSSIVGGFSPNVFWLMSTRIAEGFGFILTVVSIPPLIATVTSEQHKRASLALWGTYIPIGSGLMMILAGPILGFFDWRALWWVASLLVLLFSILVIRVVKTGAKNVSLSSPRPNFKDTWFVIRRPGPILLSLIFLLYSSQFSTLVGFLPLILVETNGYSLPSAIFVSSLVVLLNGLGCAFSGWLNSRGINPISSIIVGCLAMIIGVVATLYPDVSGVDRICGAAVFSFFAGLVPSSLFSEIPRNSPQNSFMSSISGMLVQGSGIGQLVGPPVAAAFIVWGGGWEAAGIPLVFASTVAIIFATILGYDKKRSEFQKVR